MHLPLQALVLAALSLEGALAQPAHRHQHKHRRDLADVLGKRQPFDWNSLDWAQICDKPDTPCYPDAKAAPAAPAAPSVALVVAPSSSSAAPPVASSSAPASAAAPASGSSGSSTSGTSGSSSGTSTGNCVYPSDVWDQSKKDTSMGSAAPSLPNYPGGITSADGAPFSGFGDPSGTHSDAVDADYQGNVGSTYGHNMFPLQDCDVSGQDHTISFTNAASESIEVAMWNKVGDNYQMPNVPGPITGAFRNAFWKFSLGAGQSTVFAVQANSQIAFSQACNRAFAGNFDCTWGEADFADVPNGGNSGYDRSSIPNSQGNTGLLTVCADGHDCSSEQSNSFVSVSQTNAGGNLDIGPGPAHIKVTMGG